MKAGFPHITQLPSSLLLNWYFLCFEMLLFVNSSCIFMSIHSIDFSQTLDNLKITDTFIIQYETFKCKIRGIRG